MTSSSTSDVRLAIRSLAPEPAVRHRGDPVPGPRDRRKYRDIHADRPDRAAEAAGAEPRGAGDALPAGIAQRQQHGDADALVSHVSGLPEEGRAAGRRALPAARSGVGQHRQPDRAARGRAGVGQLLHAARREAGGGAGLQLAGGRPDLSGPSGRRAQLHLLGQPVRPRSRRDRQEDPRERLPDDDRRRLGRRLRRHRPGALAADPDPGPDEAGDAARVALAAHGRPARALGAGLRAAQARLHGRSPRRRRSRACSRRSAPTR